MEDWLDYEERDGGYEGVIFSFDGDIDGFDEAEEKSEDENEEAEDSPYF